MSDIAVALDLGGTNIKGALVDREGALASPYLASTGDDHSPEAVIDRLVAAADSLRAEAEKIEGTNIIGVGLGCPGGVYQNRAVISQSPNFPSWRDVNLREPLEEWLQLPVVIENDANVAALAEFTAGVGREVDSMVLLTLGTGIGGGIILNGRIWQGKWGMAGEIGHVTVEPDGPVCGCGNHGCLEALASGPALVKKVKAAISNGEAQTLVKLAEGNIESITPAMIYEAAKRGGDVSGYILTEAAKYIGIVIADVLNLLNIPLFVIGGGISAAFDLMGPTMREEVCRRAYRIPAENVRIEQAALENQAGALGAGILALQEFGRASEGDGA